MNSECMYATRTTTWLRIAHLQGVHFAHLAHLAHLSRGMA